MQNIPLFCLYIISSPCDMLGENCTLTETPCIIKQTTPLQHPTTDFIKALVALSRLLTCSWYRLNPSNMIEINETNRIMHIKLPTTFTNNLSQRKRDTAILMKLAYINYGQWYQQNLLLNCYRIMVLHPSTLCRLYICGHVDKRRVMSDEKLWWLRGNSNLDMIVVLCPVVEASIGISQHQYFCCLISPPDNLNLDQTQNYF